MSCELGAAALRDQQPHRQDVEHVKCGKRRNRGLERIGRCDRTDDNGAKSADSAYAVEGVRFVEPLAPLFFERG